MSSEAASALGRMAKGVPKKLSEAERERRRSALALVRYRGGRKPKEKK